MESSGLSQYLPQNPGASQPHTQSLGEGLVLREDYVSKFKGAGEMITLERGDQWVSFG